VLVHAAFADATGWQHVIGILERFYAKRMGATTSEIKASHVLFISQPEEIARVIGQAANAPMKTATR
jgi:hypothetical protein